MSNDPRNDPWEMLRIESDRQMRGASPGIGWPGGCGGCATTLVAALAVVLVGASFAW